MANKASALYIAHIEKLYEQPGEGGADERQELEVAILKGAARHWRENGGTTEHGYLPAVDGEVPKPLFTLYTDQKRRNSPRFYGALSDWAAS